MAHPLLRPVHKKTCDPFFGGHAMGIILLCVGLLLGGLHFYNQRAHQQLLDTGTRAEATVVNVIRHDTGRGRKHHTAFYPVIRFTDTAGKVQLIEMTTDAGAGMKAGDTVRIVYQPDNPQKMDLEEPLHTGGTLILALAGGICALAGLGIIGDNIHQSRRFAAAVSSRCSKDVN